MTLLTVGFDVQLGAGPKRRPRREAGPDVPAGRVPRVARLMALAIRLDGLISDGSVADQAELARLGQVTPARLTQIMNLLCLAPDIQEALLCLPPTMRGRDAFHERQLRPIAAEASWRKQRQMWVARTRAEKSRMS